MAIGVEKSHSKAGGSPIIRAPAMRESRRGMLVRSLSVIVTLALWEWYGRGVDPIFMSYPTGIVTAVPRMLATGELQAAFWVSLQGLLVAIALAILVGVPLGLVTGR